MLLFSSHNHVFFLSILLIAADNPSGKPTFVNIEVAGFINFGKNLIKTDPKAPPDFIILFICALLNFLSADMLFSTLFLNSFICDCAKCNS